jgi:hypothetical protein
MSRFITKGVNAANVVIRDRDYVTHRDYEITDRKTGEKTIAERQANGKYRTRLGETLWENITVKQAKQHFGNWLDAAGDRLELGVGSREAGVGESAGDQEDIWGCCHPCAIIIEMLGAIPETTLEGPDGDKLKRLIYRTLDNYGYATSNGEPDYEACRREVDRWFSR